MKALIGISEEQLESLNRLVTTGFAQLDAFQAEKSPDVKIAHEFLIDARQALVEAQEVDAATTFDDIEHQLTLQLNAQGSVVITPGEEQ